MASYEFVASGETLNVGAITSGSYVDTQVDAGTVRIDHSGNEIDYELLANIGDTAANRDVIALAVRAHLNAESSGSIQVYCWDYVDSAWDLLPNSTLAPSSVPVLLIWPDANMSQNWVDTNGDMRIRFWGTGLTGFFVDRYLTVQQFKGTSGTEGEDILTAEEIARATADLITAEHGWGSYRSRDEVNGFVVDVPGANEFTMNYGTEDDDIYNGLLARFIHAEVSDATTWDTSVESAEMTFSNGDLTVQKSSGAVRTWAICNTVRSTGKLRVEVAFDGINQPAIGEGCGIAIVDPANVTLTNNPGHATNEVAYYSSGRRVIEGVSSAGWGDTFDDNDVIAIEIDFDALPFIRLEFFKNGVSQGEGATGFDIQSGLDYAIAIMLYDVNDQATARFTTSSQTGTPSSGFSAWDSINTAVVGRVAFGLISDYVGATKTIHIDPNYQNFPFTPAVGDEVRIIDWDSNAIAIGGQPALSAIFDTPLTEGYAAPGAAPTLAQALSMIWSMLSERNISSVTLTTRQLDGATTAMTFDLDDADAPLDQSRAT